MREENNYFRMPGKSKRDQKKNPERRASARYITIDDVWAELDNLDKCRIKDISVGGICLITPAKLTVNNIYHIKIINSDMGVISPMGKIIWSRTAKEDLNDQPAEYYEYGLKFITVN